MKRIWDLSEGEVLALTDEQVARFVDIECAHEGAPILPEHPGQKPVAEDPEPDQTLYSVTGVSYYFTDKSVADTLSAALSGASRFDTRKFGNVTVAIEPPSYAGDAGAVNTHLVVSMRAHDAHRDAIQANANLLGQWESDIRDYESALRKRHDAAQGVYNVINEARETAALLQRLEAALAEYVSLADGDEAIALRFLYKAYPEASEFEKFGPTPADLNE